MIRLDTPKCESLVTAAQLHKQLPGVLAAFEVDLLWELTERCLGESEDCPAQATEAEWAVVEQAVAGLRSEFKRYCTMPALESAA